MSVVMAALFAVLCFGFALSGFSSLDTITEPAQLSDARGFAWFWTFLGIVALVFGALGVWIVKTHKDGEES
jgi:hypothetical protein